VVILTVVGLQGLVALAVQQRVKEIAIRVALGAGRLAITGFVATAALRPVLWGLVAGIVGCIAIVRVMRAMLFGLSEFEPASLVVSCLLLVAAAVTAIAGPLTRALGVDPAETLKAT
jgi:ABC-type antimicrobial peptide transport system permease subunit